MSREVKTIDNWDEPTEFDEWLECEGTTNLARNFKEVAKEEILNNIDKFDGEVDARHGFVHVPQEHRVMEQLRPGGEERSCLVPGMNAPSGQSQCSQSRNAAAAQRLLCGPVPGDGIPCFVFHFIFDLGRRSKKLNGRKEYY